MQEKLKDLEMQMLKLKNLYNTNSITRQEYVDDTPPKNIHIPFVRNLKKLHLGLTHIKIPNGI